MKILSDFKDYYDGINASFHDDIEPVYRRLTNYIHLSGQGKKEEQEIQNALLPIVSLQKQLPASFLCFCGKVYPFFSLYHGYSVELGKHIGYVFYYDFEAYLKALLDKIQSDHLHGRPNLAEYNELASDKKRYAWDNRVQLNRAFFRDVYPTLDRSINDATFRFFKTPCFIYYGNNSQVYTHDKINKTQSNKLLHINPRLSQLDFQKAMDPYLAYQELSMYIGNNLAEQMDPKTTLTDKERAETHGFDKWSFRRHKTEDRKYHKKQKS